MPFWPITRSALVCLLSLTASSWPVDETHAGAAVDIRALPLLDQDGKPTSLHAFEDRAMVLHFIFTHCVAACHLQVRNLRAVREALPADTKRRVQFVSVSIDPEHDTPETLKRYAQSNGIDDANWRFVTASPAVVDQLTQSLAVKRRIVSDAQIDHTLAVFLFDARGRLIQRYADPVDGARLVREIGEVVRLFGIREPH
jgi:cytochrome oxidase Cu insertion factor (SCO1/SenC/PrrC family)